MRFPFHPLQSPVSTSAVLFLTSKFYRFFLCRFVLEAVKLCW
nr:MAG TPA: hypothetical protein [Caudoviricetes sp.]